MKKIIDQNGRLFGLISIIDVIVLLLVAVLAVALVLKQSAVSPSATSTTAGTPVTYTMLAREIPVDVANGIQVGDKVYDKNQETNGSIGTITNVEMAPAVKVVKLPDGTSANATKEGFCDVTISVDATCDIVNGHYRFNNVYELGVNAGRTFYTPFAIFTAFVTQIG